MNITSAQYTKNKEDTGNDNIKATIDGKVWFVPLDPDNTDYAEILKQVKQGTLTIKDADE
jgi:hypothetical protein|tara:strand:- start:20 stop:199 length:180 start_codon:yes stop_codon:yes gene_type:complete